MGVQYVEYYTPNFGLILNLRYFKLIYEKKTQIQFTKFKNRV